jgi:C4-dicarboxylate-specific signal transduction histidine kinase
MVSQRTEQLSVANAQLQFENAERRRYEEMLRSRMEWLVVVNRQPGCDKRRRSAEGLSGLRW